MRPSSPGVKVDRRTWGRAADGGALEEITLAARDGVTARIFSFGATIHSLSCPDRTGHIDDILLGPADPRDHVLQRCFFGSTVGRVANRIAFSRFEVNGRIHQLDSNENPHHLHGGPHGLDQKSWRVASLHEGDAGEAVLECVSPDGECGYPGTLRAEARFRLSEGGILEIVYSAVCDVPTICNLTNHNVYNLCGSGSGESIRDHLITVAADDYLPVHPDLIPTGERRCVHQTAFDLRRPRRLGDILSDTQDEQLRIAHGLDHSFILRQPHKVDRPDVTLFHPGSGRQLELRTTSPAVQVYTGNFLSGAVVSKGGRDYRPHDGVCLEPQGYPNAPNEPSFPSVRLTPGDVYTNRVSLHLSATT